MNSLLLSLLVASSPTLSVKIEGEGYVRFSRDGRAVFSRDFTLTVADGKLATIHGLNTVPTVQIGTGISNLRISKVGELFATYPSGETKVGTLVVGVFAPTSALTLTDNYFVATDRPTYSPAGENGAGVFVTVEQTNSVPPVKQPEIPVLPSSRTPEPSVKQVTAKAQKALVSKAVTPLQEGTILRVRINSETLVNGETFSLTDIATFEGSQALVDQISGIALGRTPILGYSRPFELERTRLQLRAAKLPVDAIEFIVPESTSIRRPSQTVEYTELFDVAKKAIQASLGNESVLTDQSQNQTIAMILPTGKRELRTGNVSWSGTRASVTIDAFVDGKKIKSRSMSVMVTSQYTMPKVGSLVKVVVLSPGMKIQFSGKVTRTSGLNTVEIRREDGATFTGTLIAEGTIEVKI
jgi:hypothetical protein